MANLNRVILIGRLTATPELKITPTNINVCSFTVAVNRPKTKEGEKVADFIECLAWRGTAEFISNYFTKGSAIFIEGNLQTRSYKDKEDKKRKATEVLVTGVDFVEAKRKESAEDSYLEEISATAEGLPF